MKNIILLFLSILALFSFSLQAQVNYKINENSYQKIDISFVFGDLKKVDVKIDESFFSRIFIDGCAGSKNIGDPELPVSVSMLEIPVFGDYVLNVYGKDYEIIDAKTLEINFPIYPSQPSISKSHRGNVEFVQNLTTYQTDNFYALPLARFEKVGMMRNVNLGQLYVSPVQYNPVTNEIKIYKEIDVEILFKKVELVKTQMIKDLHDCPLFHSSIVINPIITKKAEFENTPIKYLIVAHEIFRGELDEFISWKKRKGFLVEIAYTDENSVGTTTTSIANFIKSHYDNATIENPAPTFVLLVGDVQQIPTFTGAGMYGSNPHPTDLYYFTWADENFPCCYYGRFSAQNIVQLTPQIDKTLQYEQFTMPNPDYLNSAVLVAGYDPSHLYAPVYGNGFVEYVSQNYATTEYGYDNVYAHYHPCSSEAAQIRTEIGEGVGIANYTAHCGTSGWSNPTFNTNHIKDMNNLNKYGLMIGSCCESNKFDVNECFGEALLRAEGKGAVGYIGGSDYTYWDEDYYWSIGLRTSCTATPTYNPLQLGAYDRLFHTHNEDNNSWMTTFGSMIKSGNEAVQSSTTDLKKYYWEIYHLMGDPSIMTYLTKPSLMQVEINNVIPLGTNSLNAKVAPFSYCALTNSENELLSAGFADADGNISLKFNPIEVSAQYEFAAWAQNYVQYFKTIYSGNAAIHSNNKEMICVISPNPAYSTLTIETENNISSYVIMDLSGKTLVSQQNINNNNVQVNIALMANGIYFVKVIDNEQNIAVQKFVKL
ncbi:MAG: C25 family cysteine peptidase [Lentimicrobiaceae bacterium]|nr:C25 family cysteine peptidase [Lentimicrobiaceae bacterium]